MRAGDLHQKIRKAGCVLLGAVLFLFALLPPARAADPLEDVITAAFRGRTLHSAAGEKLLSDENFLSKHAGTGTGDWAALAMARFCTVDGDGRILYRYDEDYGAYRASLEAALSAYYESSGISPGTKLTEYFRMGIVLTALGGDCEALLLEATVNNPVALTRLSIITLDYALIALNMRDFELPAQVSHTPADFLNRILSLQLADGGWSLTSLFGGAGDVDVTAMTLTALAPYYRAGNKTVTAAADRALAFLSLQQRSAGDFAAYGLYNCESTAQVLTALVSLGIDPLKDGRFIKNGVTVADGLMQYRLPDGSFTHAYANDPENPDAAAGRYNYLATDEAAYALVALWRQQQGENTLYDMRPDTASTLASVWHTMQRLIETMFARLMTLLRSLGTAL